MDEAFGAAVALTFDGNGLAVGATGEDSAAAGVGGDESDNSLSNSGAVYLFTRDGGTWSQNAYVKASHSGPSGSQTRFGTSVSLSSDGVSLAVVRLLTPFGGNRTERTSAHQVWGVERLR